MKKVARSKKAAPKKASPKRASPNHAAKKAAPKKAVAKKAAPKKAAPKKVAPKKAAPKKAVAKRASPKKAAPKKAVAKRASPKKAAPKKAVAKKAAPKKAVAKKASPKKAVARKTAPKKPTVNVQASAQPASTRPGQTAETQRLLQLGDQHYRGRGVPEDFERARELYLQAAELGDTDAMSNLVMFYREGTHARWGGAGEDQPATGVDLPKALHWAREAIRLGGGHPGAVKHLEELIAAGGAPPALLSPGDDTAQRAQLRDRIHVADLDAHAETLLASVLPSLRLVRSGDDARIGGTRLGGLPDLPSGTEWPRGPKAPLSFIAQLDLAELAATDASGLLPRDGLLSFFYDLGTNPWGLALEERAQIAVLHTPSGAALERRDKPADLVSPHKYTYVELTSTPVRAELELTLPSLRTKEIRAFGFDQAEHDKYCDEVLVTAYKWPTSEGIMHRVLGHPDANQGDMTRRLAYLFAGKPDAIDRESDPVVEEDAARFRLLLQLDTDDDLMTHWGSGRLYFWIREEDLKAARFDATFFQFQG
jgi:uncharacterized protein YwqG